MAEQNPAPLVFELIANGTQLLRILNEAQAVQLGEATAEAEKAKEPTPKIEAPPSEKKKPMEITERHVNSFFKIKKENEPAAEAAAVVEAPQAAEQPDDENRKKQRKVEAPKEFEPGTKVVHKDLGEGVIVKPMTRKCIIQIAPGVTHCVFFADLAIKLADPAA